MTATACASFNGGTGTFSPPDRCCQQLGVGGVSGTYAPAGTLDWSPILALVPPFHVEVP